MYTYRIVISVYIWLAFLFFYPIKPFERTGTVFRCNRLSFNRLFKIFPLSKQALIMVVLFHFSRGGEIYIKRYHVKSLWLMIIILNGLPNRQRRQTGNAMTENFCCIVFFCPSTRIYYYYFLKFFTVLWCLDLLIFLENFW